jgi:hypothetical protein
LKNSPLTAGLLKNTPWCFGDGSPKQIRLDNLSVTDFEFGSELASPVARGAFIGGMPRPRPIILGLRIIQIKRLYY